MHDTALLSIAVTPRTEADREKLAQGLARLAAEDPTLRVTTGQTTGEVIIWGVSDRHLENILDRLSREFNVAVHIGRPQVAFREAVRRPADGEIKYGSRTGGRGHYAHVRIRLSPGEPGSGYVFENRIAGGAIPDVFINPIADAIEGALTGGVLAGYPMEDIRVELCDGSYHDVDSSEFAFRTAAVLAFQDAAKKAAPVLLEPVMRVRVVVHQEHLADVVGNLLGRRGQIECHEVREGMHVVLARVPLSEMFAYAVDLRERTGGRGAFDMHFDSYQPCRPADDDDDRASLVSAPLKPRPTPGHSHVALPEPDGDTPGP